MVLNHSYFDNPNTPELARSLLGKYLCQDNNGIINKYMITEVEAYHGFEDKASHARFGKTARNNIMFGQSGFSYIYLCYGIHWLFNIVTGPEEFPAAVLLRGIDNIFGPGKVTKYLGINASMNHKLLVPGNGLWLEDLGYIASSDNIRELPRVGIDYAEEYKDMPWRFILNNN